MAQSIRTPAIPKLPRPGGLKHEALARSCPETTQRMESCRSRAGRGPSPTPSSGRRGMLPPGSDASSIPAWLSPNKRDLGAPGGASMTLEKPRLQPARIGAGAGEARWRLAAVNASAPAWWLRGGDSGNCGWERVSGGGEERSPERRDKVGAARAGTWRWLGGRVLQRKVRVGPSMSSRHRPNCHSRPSPKGAGPSLPPPGIPRGGGSSSFEGPRSYLLPPINPSSVEGVPS